MCFFKKKSAFEACCQEHLKQNERQFTYVFQDTTFNIEVKSLWPFILNYARIRNRPDEIKSVLTALEGLSEKDIQESFTCFVPTMGDLLTGSHPRFTVKIGDNVLVVMAQDSFVPNTKHPATSALYASLPSKLHISKKELVKAFNRLLQHPELMQEKSRAQTKLEEYIRDYLGELERSFEAMSHRIHFKPNEKFGPYEDTIPILYIGFNDMSARDINIRYRPEDDYNEDTDPVIAHYNTLRELLEDGWELD